MDLKSKPNPKNNNNKQSDQKPETYIVKEEERERVRNIQSPRWVGEPTAALTATSRAISDE